MTKKSPYMPAVMKHILMVLLASIALYARSVFPSSKSWADSVPVPPGATLQIINDNLQHNGLNMSIGRLESTKSLQTNLDFYRVTWGAFDSSDTPGYVEQRFNNWIAISRLEDGVNVVIQFNEEAAVPGSAFVSVMHLGQSSVLGFDSSLHPGNAKLLSNTRTSDFGSDSTVEVIELDLSIDSAIRYYKKRFKRNGWNLVSDRSIQKAQVLMFNKKMKKSEVYLGRSTNGSTLAVINQVTRDD